MADLPYRYDVKIIDNDQLSIVQDNVANGKQTKPKIITLSGCRDCQTSADAIMFKVEEVLQVQRHLVF